MRRLESTGKSCSVGGHAGVYFGRPAINSAVHGVHIGESNVSKQPRNDHRTLAFVAVYDDGMLSPWLQFYDAEAYLLQGNEHCTLDVAGRPLLMRSTIEQEQVFAIVETSLDFPGFNVKRCHHEQMVHQLQGMSVFSDGQPEHIKRSAGRVLLVPSPCEVLEEPAVSHVWWKIFKTAQSLSSQGQRIFQFIDIACCHGC
jgi:hypothetical protein